MVLTIRATASGPRAAMPGVITATPSAKFWRSWSLSSRILSVLASMVESSLVEGSGWPQFTDARSHGQCRRAPGIAVVGRGRVRAVVRGRLATWSSDAAYDVRCAHSNLIKSGRTVGCSRFLAGRVHQRDGAAVPKELGELRKIAVPEREAVVFAVTMASHQPYSSDS